MSDPSDHDRKADADANPEQDSSSLRYLVQRIKSQPLLVAVGVLLILANLAAVSIEGLRALLPAAIAIFVVGVAAWMIVELARFRRRGRSPDGDDVRVAAQRIGKGGEVLGIDDASETSSTGATSVKVKATDVQGQVIGIRRGPRQP